MTSPAIIVMPEARVTTKPAVAVAPIDPEPIVPTAVVKTAQTTVAPAAQSVVSKEPQNSAQPPSTSRPNSAGGKKFSPTSAAITTAEWSHDETLQLLAAWHEVLRGPRLPEQPANRLVHEKYLVRVSPSRSRPKSEKAVVMKKIMLLHNFNFILNFNEGEVTTTTTTTTTTASNDDTAKCQMTAKKNWFALTSKEQRGCFTAEVELSWRKASDMDEQLFNTLKVIVEHIDRESTTSNEVVNAVTSTIRSCAAATSETFGSSHEEQDTRSTNRETAVADSVMRSNRPSNAGPTTTTSTNNADGADSTMSESLPDLDSSSKDAAEDRANSAEEGGEGGGSLQNHTVSWISAIAAAVSKSMDIPPNVSRDLEQSEYPTDKHGLIDLVPDDEKDTDEVMLSNADGGLDLQESTRTDHVSKARDRVSKPTTAVRRGFSRRRDHSDSDSSYNESGDVTPPVRTTSTRRKRAISSLASFGDEDENGGVGSDGGSSSDGEVVTERFTLTGVYLVESKVQQPATRTTAAKPRPARVTRAIPANMEMGQQRQKKVPTLLSTLKKRKVHSELFAAVNVLEKQAQQLRLMLVQIREEHQLRRVERERWLESEDMERQDQFLEREHSQGSLRQMLRKHLQPS